MELIWFVMFVVVVYAAIAEAGRQRRIKKAYTFKPDKAHGSARFATKKDLKGAGLFKRGTLHLGFFDGWRELFMNNNGHIVVCAGARSGKLVSYLARLVMTLPGTPLNPSRKKFSLGIFDPKCEISAICLHWLKRCGWSINILNPYGILLDHLKGLKQATCNVMSSLNPKSGSFFADCAKLAEAICYEENYGLDNHWIESARQLIRGIIAALMMYGAPQDKNLVAVRQIITSANGQSVPDFCREVMAIPGVNVYIRQDLGRFAAPGAEDSKELNSIISTADTQTGFITGAIAENLKGGPNEISFKGLKRKPGTVVSTVLPLDKLPVSHKYFRVILSTGISDVLAEGLSGNNNPVAFVVDEMAQVGPLRILADCWGMAAGAAALQMVGVYQNAGQIMNQFKTAWQTMLANSTSLFFGVRDHETADLVSRMCGITDVLSQSKNVSIDLRTGEPVVNNSASQTARPLLHPDEVRFGLKPDEMLLFCDRVPGVIRGKRRPYFECPDLKKGKHYRDNPYYQEESAIARFLRWVW
jgi:type IV secretion system protein VirD4